MRCLLGLLGLACALTHCRAPLGRGAPPAAPAAPGASGPPATSPEPLGASLGRAYTGQQDPTLTVVNRYPALQHVFVDEVAVGTLRPGETRTFQLVPGPHQVTCSDSADPRRGAAGASELFEAGYAYRYELATW